MTGVQTCALPICFPVTIKAMGMIRNISDNGVLFTSLWETFRPHPYRATSTEKYFTIGFGHYGPDVKKGQTITKEQAIEMLRQDMSKAVKKANELVSTAFN